MKREFSKILMILLSAVLWALGGCNPSIPDSGTLRVRIPLDDHTGHYSLRDVELHTVKDIHAMAGSTAVILANGDFNTYVDVTGNERISSAVLGSSPSAQFINVGGVLHPADFESLAMTATMYHFECIKNFYDQVSGNNGLKFPRMILMNVTVAHNYGGQEANTINNAEFVPSLDMFWINPYKNSNVPLAFNGGVLAHEYLHNVFNARFHKIKTDNLRKGLITPEESASLDEALDSNELNEWVPTSPPFTEPVPSPDMTPLALSHSELLRLNNFILGGLNEGIADFFGYEYSRNPGWITASLPTQVFRDLSKDKNFSLTSNGQQRLIMESLAGRDPQSRLDVHWLGAYFSRMLYLVSLQWGDLPAEQATLTFMDRYSDQFSAESGKRYISMGDLVRLFFKDRKPTGMLCENVRKMFSGELSDGSFTCDDDLMGSGIR